MTRHQRIGVLGGTFDPIHIGHLVAATCAREACALDRVLMMVAHDPWQKSSSRPITPAEQRFQMVTEAVEGISWLEVSDMEIRRGGATYTADTLAELQATEPDAHLYLLGGADMAAGLASWERWADVAELADLVVMNRPGSPDELPGQPWRCHRVTMPNLDVSSSEIRRRISDGKPVDFLVPEAALVAIRAWGLYPGSS